jgi:hypothetical protein
MNLTIVVAEGIDRFNLGEETVCDIKVVPEITTLQKVHDAIVKVMQIDEGDDLFYIFAGKTGSQLSLTSTFEELGAISGDSLILDAKNSRKRKSNMLKPTKEEDTAARESGILELMCTTRLLDTDGNPFRRVRVVVQSHHNTNYLMHDISNLWGGKSGLKFKCGRTVLSADKSYAELGVETESEIAITGGRG